MKNYSALTKGILYDKYNQVRKNFYEKIDAAPHAEAYVGQHSLSYAEPEYAGKFLDICACFYEREADKRALEKGMTVVRSIQKSMRADGYIGMLGEGNELKNFSVWNQAFTLYGLTRMYEATGDLEIKALVIKAADWIVNTFVNENPPDILDAFNSGSQNITAFFPMLRAYRATGEKKYLHFVDKIINECEATDMNLISFDSILNLRSKKGIEMLIVYLGVLDYGVIMNNEKAKAAAKRYFDEVLRTQIRNTGNGTINEHWTKDGNAARLMPTEHRPNETCVAVGIVELALALFHTFQSVEYLDEIERTVFNHICGSLEKSGEDLAYYQGNYGKKIYRTPRKFYQCCRYRGFTLFSYLNDMLYYFQDNTLIPIIYTSSEFKCYGVACKQSTNFPAEGNITFDISTSRTIKIKLRKPRWCKNYSVRVNGKKIYVEAIDGYLILELPCGEHNILLTLDEDIVISNHQIDEKKYCSINYGPLLMAHDTHFGGELWQSISNDARFYKEATNGEAIVRLVSDEMTVVDFASAGGNDPENDTYTVFIPQK